MEYSQIVVKFFETYQIEVYSDHQIIYIPSNVFDKMKEASNYINSLKSLVEDFVSRPEISKLPGINLFNIDCAVSRLNQNYPTWNVTDNDTLKINASGRGYSFGFMFGDKTFYG